jgi:hypothetical protein
MFVSSNSKERVRKIKEIDYIQMGILDNTLV